MELMKQETRDNGEKFYTSKNESLTDVIRQLHNNNFPTDEIYAFVNECIEYFEESISYGADKEEAAENLRSADSFYPVYTNEINTIFHTLGPVLVDLWDELSDFLCLEGKEDPNDYRQKVLYAYLQYSQFRVADWLEQNYEKTKTES